MREVCIVTLESRFWAKVDRRGPDECWPWIGAVKRDGYARLRLGGKHLSYPVAHRVAYQLLVGPIPDGMTIDHTCHNQSGCPGGSSCLHRRCMNPAHLEPVPGAVNTQRGVNWNRKKTHCANGHEFTPENTYTAAYGGWWHRRCRRCHADQTAAYKARQKEAAS